MIDNIIQSVTEKLSSLPYIPEFRNTIINITF